MVSRPKGLIILFWSTALKWIDKDRDDDEFRALLMQYCADSVAGQIISLGKQCCQSLLLANKPGDERVTVINRTKKVSLFVGVLPSLKIMSRFAY